MSGKRRRVAVIFKRVGPYHAARLGAAARLLHEHDAEIVCLEAASTDEEHQWKPVEAIGWRRITLFPARYEEVETYRLVYRVARRLCSSKPSVVFINGWASPEALMALGYSVVRQVPRVLMSTSQAHDKVRTRPGEAIKSWIVRRFDAAFVGGSSHAQYLNRLGQNKLEISFGYNAVDNAYFGRVADQTRMEAQRWRRRLGLPDRFFLSVARFIPEKDLETLLVAFQRFLRRVGCSDVRVSWHLVLCGDGPLRDQIEAARARLGLYDRVHLPGFVQYDLLPRFYALAEAFVLPSRKDTWGLVVNEAMAAGLPVIVSRACGCSGELVREGWNGVIVEPGDAGQLAGVLTRVAVLSTTARREWGRRSREIVSCWGLERFAEGFYQAYLAALRATLTRGRAGSP